MARELTVMVEGALDEDVQSVVCTRRQLRIVKLSVMCVGKSFLVYFILEKPKNDKEKHCTCLCRNEIQRAFRGVLVLSCVTCSLSSLSPCAVQWESSV